jgi:hypothetical protein
MLERIASHLVNPAGDLLRRTLIGIKPRLDRSLVL